MQFFLFNLNAIKIDYITGRRNTTNIYLMLIIAMSIKITNMESLTYISFLCDSVQISNNKFNNSPNIIFFISKDQSERDADSLSSLWNIISELVKRTINNRQQNFNVKTFVKSENINQNGFTASDNNGDITYDKILDMPQEITFNNFVNIKNIICFESGTNKKISIDDICKLSKLDKIKLTMSIKLYSVCTNNIIYIKAHLKNITVKQQLTKDIINQNEQKKYNDEKIFVPKFSSKTSTIIEKILEILKNGNN